MPTGERANPEVKQLIERHNGCARKNTDAYRDRKNNLKLPPSGRPDYDFWFASRRGPRVSGSIEFKAVKYDFKRKRQPPFEFARLSPEQREWLTHGFPELPLAKLVIH